MKNRKMEEVMADIFALCEWIAAVSYDNNNNNNNNK
jgi:hypothetical protein